VVADFDFAEAGLEEVVHGDDLARAQGHDGWESFFLEFTDDFECKHFVVGVDLDALFLELVADEVVDLLVLLNEFLHADRVDDDLLGLESLTVLVVLDNVETHLAGRPFTGPADLRAVVVKGVHVAHAALVHLRVKPVGVFV